MHCTALREKPSRWVLTDGAAQAPALPLQNEHTRPVESGDVRANMDSRGSDNGFTCKYLVFVTATAIQLCAFHCEVPNSTPLNLHALSLACNHTANNNGKMILLRRNSSQRHRSERSSSRGKKQ